jgi:hypothetical protein
VEWGAEYLKLYFEQLPTPTSPEQGKPLIPYVSATDSVLNRALVVEKEITKNDKIVR